MYIYIAKERMRGYNISKHFKSNNISDVIFQVENIMFQNVEKTICKI